MSETKLIRDLQKAEREGGKLFSQALAALKQKDARITALVRTNCNLERQIADEQPDIVNLGEYGRKDLEAAIAGDDKQHLRIVLDSIFGAA